MTVQKFLRLQSFFRGIIFAAMEKGKQMAKEYIEREAAKARLRIWITNCVLDGENEAADCFRDCIDLLDSIPAADVAEVRHGRWEKHGSKWQCTNCKVLMNLDGTPQENSIYYCPNCGAYMMGENNGKCE
nr:MAG TPA: DNA-directed RNA polymerase [Caudoviricetes sp.]